jgi:hypothetical protein
MAVEAPSGIVKWYNSPVGERTWNNFRAQLTGKDYPGASRKTSYVKLTDKEADEVIENIKNDPEGVPFFDEANAPDKAEEYQRWLVSRYLTKPRENTFDNTQKESSAPEPTSSALVPVRVNNDNLVEEKIDERILAILGIGDVFDLTYEEYISLLKEKSIEYRMSGADLPTESVELITEEFKRVKGKSGKFKVKSEKINIAKVIDKRTGYSGKDTLDPKKLLPPGKEDEEEKSFQKDILNFLKNDLLDTLKSINSVVVDILDILKEQREIDKKKTEQERRTAEIEKKKSSEAKLERQNNKEGTDAVNKITKPFTSFFDTIKNFLMNVLLGSAINFLLSVIKDPSIILTPLKNFANMIIGFLNGIISFLWNLVVSPINFVIAGINNGIQGLINQINNAIRLIPGTRPIVGPQIPTIPGPPQIPTFSVQQQEGGGETINVGDISLMSGGGKTINVGDISLMSGGGKTINVGDISLMSGGGVDKKTGVKVSGFGKDTQLTALSPGEVVFSNPAADFWGRDNLLAMNAMGGGTNKPKFGSLGIQTMQGGGVAGGGGRIIFGAGHAARTKGSSVGTDNLPVQGTTDPRTGVSESRAMMHLIESMQRIVSSNPQIYSNIGFQNITETKGLRGMRSTTKQIEGSGNQFVELHLDQFGGGGRSGVISRNRTSVDNSLGALFGFFPKNFKQGDLAIPDEGGTIVELSAVDDPKLRPFLNEVKQNKYGPATQELATKLLTAVVGKNIPKAPNLPPPPPSQPRVTMLPVPVNSGGGQVPSSSSSANQAEVPSFSAEDPKNMSTLVVKAIYNMVG